MIRTEGFFLNRGGRWASIRSSDEAVQLAYRRRAIFNDFSLTAKQIAESLLAIPAFLPATVSTGYVAAWATDLHGFRRRSLIERLFWSVPLSLAISTISAYLIGLFTSLNIIVTAYLLCTIGSVAVLFKERLDLRREGRTWNVGWQPFGRRALALGLIWAALVILLVSDLQIDHKLYMSVGIQDLSFRVSWTDSVIRTGIPPSNPLYFLNKQVAMRNHYFWYVICAAVARMSQLRARPVFVASIIWAGVALFALVGLYLKHFLETGERLRQQLLLAAWLAAVTGLGICVNFLNLIFHHGASGLLSGVWTASHTSSWLDSLLWSPHHVASLVCCMFAFVLAWMRRTNFERHIAEMAFIAASLASAFGLSIYAALAFSLLMVTWGIWQIAFEHTLRPALFLMAGGAGAGILLIPYFRELLRSSSPMHRGDGSPSFLLFTVREMLPPDGLLSAPLFRQLAVNHPSMAHNIANLLLLAPGYLIELGFYVPILLVYLTPAWRGRTPLTPAQRSLVFIAMSTIPLISFVRTSALMNVNDFAWRGSLFLQFTLLLLALEVFESWHGGDRKQTPGTASLSPASHAPLWLRSITFFALVLGVFTLFYQTLILRFVLPAAELSSKNAHNPAAGDLPHNAYISNIGYSQLQTAIPSGSVVQFNPSPRNQFWADVDWLGVGHQIAITTDKPWCGSELGGDPSGCPILARAIDALYAGPATAEQARSTCQQFGIQYLVARIYDPAWHDRNSWVWTLKPVVNDPEFRALDCAR